jgi:hypothetical protein
MAGATLPFLFHPILRIKAHNLNRHGVVWRPIVTIAAVIEQNCKFLLLEEHPCYSINLLSQQHPPP